MKERIIAAAVVLVLLGTCVAVAKACYERQRPARPWTDETRKQNGLPPADEQGSMAP